MVITDNDTVREDLISLWSEAFGDKEEYIRFFLDTHRGCRCLTISDCDGLVSALYLIDGALNGIEGCYLFAAATFEKYRGRGCMARLLEKAAHEAVHSGKSFIALVPAEKSLFDYYARFGYKTAFYAKPHTDFANIPAAENSFVWCAEHEEYIRKEHEKYKTDMIFDGGRIFSVYSHGDKRFVKAPSESKDGCEYGMLLALDEKAKGLTELNSYIGLTLE